MIGILNDFLTKIKPLLDIFKDKKEQILLSVIIIFVGLSSFALGQYSIKTQTSEKSDLPSRDTSVVQEKNTQNNSNSKTNGKFLASKNGTKYYLSTCSGASRISQSNRVYFNSEAEAQSAGYSRASNCSF